MFPFVNLQVNDSFGEQNHTKFSFGGHCPLMQVHACICGRCSIPIVQTRQIWNFYYHLDNLQ